MYEGAYFYGGILILSVLKSEQEKNLESKMKSQKKSQCKWMEAIPEEHDCIKRDLMKFKGSGEWIIMYESGFVG